MNKNDLDPKVAEFVESIKKKSRSDGEAAEIILEALVAGTSGEAVIGAAGRLDRLEFEFSDLPAMATMNTRDQGGSTAITLRPDVLEEAGFARDGGDRVREIAGDGQILLKRVERGGDRDE